MLMLLPAIAWANEWSQVHAPIGAEPAIYGGYNAGCIAGADTVPVHSDYWELVNIKRERNFAHPDLYAFLQTLGAWSVKDAHLGKLVIGDLSQPAGGPLPFGHASHQVGLDADIRFFFLPATKTLTNLEREGFREVPVATHHMIHDAKGVRLESHLTPEWQKPYALILEKAASQPQVERIFVSPPIKRELCALFPDHPKWLRKISPYFGHEEHFHVRLACPASSPQCTPQDPVKVSADDTTKVGCAGQALDWWFAASTEKGSYLGDALADVPQHAAEKKIPQACQELIAKAPHEKTIR